MNYPEDAAKAAEYLKKAIPHMVSKKVPANPINYALWYSYVANNLPALNRELDHLISAEGTYTAEQSQELYFHHIVSEYLEDHHKTLEGITQVAAQLLTRLGESMSGSETFEGELSADIEQLKQARSMNEITTIVDAVVATTENIRSNNNHFQEGMKQATEEINSLRTQLEQAEKQAFFDQLTQLYNRHAFDRQLQQLLSNESMADKVCLVLADLDHFKAFNDDYGHIIGDRVLRRMGELVQDNCPDNAIGARYGGEEFAIILSNSSEEEAAKVAESLRERLLQLRVKIKKSDKVLDNITASFGVTRYKIGESTENFIDRADKALYRAKDNGRNRVEINLVADS